MVTDALQFRTAFSSHMQTAPSLRVAVLCSGHAPGLAHLLSRASIHAHQWTIVCCVSSETEFADKTVARAHGVPIVHHAIRDFRDATHPDCRLSDLRMRAAFDRRTVHILRGYRPDVVLLSGYRLLLTRPFLDTYPDRILNVHHSDLNLRTPDGAPRYPGLQAVRDAILAGEVETRSTIHLVNSDLDDGLPILRSEPYPVSPTASRALADNDSASLAQEIRAHEERMLSDAFGPLMEKALDMWSMPISIAS